MNPIEKVNDFLTQAETFYLTTVDGDRPKCRSVASHMLAGERLYFGIGDFKEVYRQMQKNPHEEFCAAEGRAFCGITGTLFLNRIIPSRNRCWRLRPPCRRSTTKQQDTASQSSIWSTRQQNSEA